MTEPDLSPEEQKLLKHFAHTRTYGAESAEEKRTAERLIEIGYVARDADGFLKITAEGRRRYGPW